MLPVVQQLLVSYLSLALAHLLQLSHFVQVFAVLLYLILQVVDHMRFLLYQNLTMMHHFGYLVRDVFHFLFQFGFDLCLCIVVFLH